MNYYNEWDPQAAAWLRELIENKLIPEGVVDERSITEVQAKDLKGFTQCHFFAGIGGWPLALQLAGIQATTRLWTGSPPCQPFSAAGKQLGQYDSRHLAPVFLDLISQCRPPVLFGEQVAPAIAKLWMCDLQTHLEGEGYAVGFAVLPACGVGAPHKRDRLFFGSSLRLGHTTSTRQCTDKAGQHSGIREQLEGSEPRQHNQYRRTDGGLANTVREQRNRRGGVRARRRIESANGSGDCGMAHAGNSARQPGKSRSVERRLPQSVEENATVRADADNSFWSDADWLGCRDGKFRPVEPGTFPLANGVPSRVGRLRGYGNAIVPQVAAEFIKAFLAAKAEIGV